MDLSLKVLEAGFDSGMDVPTQGCHGYNLQVVGLQVIGSSVVWGES